MSVAAICGVSLNHPYTPRIPIWRRRIVRKCYLLESEFMIAPKRQMRGGKKGSNEGRKKPSWELMRAGKVSRLFCERIPPLIMYEIECVEQTLWNRV